jgi:hypothetical protein
MTGWPETRATRDLGQVSNRQTPSLQLTRSNLGNPLGQPKTQVTPT